MIRHLFVYGTLMPGRTRWPALAPWAGDGPALDFVAGQLFDTGYGWPAAVIGNGGPIPGLTVPLNAQSLTAALEALDEIEGTNHGLFRRISTVTGNGLEAWVYEWPGKTQGFVPISRWSPRGS